MENLRIRTTKNDSAGAPDVTKRSAVGKITIMALCKQACVNRTTFYKYYGSQYDVVDDIIDELFDTLKGFVPQRGPSGILFSREMLNYLLENRTMCATLLDKLPVSLFSLKLLNIISYDDDFLIEFAEIYTEEQKRLLFSFYQYGVFGIMYQWLHSETPAPTELVYDMMCSLRKNIIFADSSVPMDSAGV